MCFYLKHFIVVAFSLSKVEQDGAETVKLVFSKLLMDDEGEYTLIATNDAGKAKCKAVLTIASGGVKPSTKINPDEVTIPPCISEKLHDSVSCYCTVAWVRSLVTPFFC